MPNFKRTLLTEKTIYPAYTSYFCNVWRDKQDMITKVQIHFRERIGETRRRVKEAPGYNEYIDWILPQQ